MSYQERHILKAERVKRERYLADKGYCRLLSVTARISFGMIIASLSYLSIFG